MQQDSHDDLVTGDTKLSILRTGIGAAVVLIAYCSLSAPSRHDWAGELVPVGSMIIQSQNWTVDAWSARKTYKFECRMNPAGYRSWIEQKLGMDWHRRVAPGLRLAYSKLTPTEQHLLEIGFETTRSETLLVQVTFTAIPT